MPGVDEQCLLADHETSMEYTDVSTLSALCMCFCHVMNIIQMFCRT